MSNAASFVVTKTRVYSGSASESHSEIIKEHKLHTDPNTVNIEITPPGNDYRLPLDEWVYRVDQADLPDWYDAAECEARVRAALPGWVAAKIVLPGWPCVCVWLGDSLRFLACGCLRLLARRRKSTADDPAYQLGLEIADLESKLKELKELQHVDAPDSSQVTAYGSSQVVAYHYRRAVC
jgi:hypothetical protein